MREEDFDFSRDPVMTAADRADRTLSHMIGHVTRWRSVLVLLCLGVITLLLPLTQFGLQSPMTLAFWANAVYSLIIASLCYYIFAPIGQTGEIRESTTYRANTEEWNALSAAVRQAGRMAEFYAFCRRRVAVEREELRMLYVEAAGVPFEVWERELRPLSEGALRARVRRGELTRRQGRYLLAAARDIPLRPINPSLILSGVPLGHLNDVGRERRRDLMGFLRPLSLVGTMLIRGAIEVGFNGGLSWQAYLVQTAVNLTVVLTWSFYGYRFGVGRARREETLIRGRAEYIRLFLEEQTAGE